MGKALWRRAFDAAEGALGPRVEQWVKEAPFAKTVVAVQRTSGFLTGVVEKQTRRTWHAVNLPASSDVLKLRRQVGDLDREVRLVRDAIERQDRRQVIRPQSPRGRKAGG
jgi:hypothetical protein